jgi:hypothetical protein
MGCSTPSVIAKSVLSLNFVGIGIIVLSVDTEGFSNFPFGFGMTTAGTSSIIGFLGF